MAASLLHYLISPTPTWQFFILSKPVIKGYLEETEKPIVGKYLELLWIVTFKANS